MAIGRLTTFGYARLRDSDGLRALLGESVQIVVDVRLRPVSRNAAFSTATRQTVEEAGYAYQWVRGLGNADYLSGGIHLEDPAAISSVTDLLQAGVDVAVMCVCSDGATCHRRTVAELAREQLPGLQVIDL